ncbi:argininosuccinate lyase [Acetoanaerobium sticklandii]|uniref:Argininosuccinate lyase n=1 Tax=Acetoanaerobium sticklandii (strain ATCC 12662 / DSM 519 / JCM 1433 / CCUG 9281 / NCIMB 10654 / HF) TaxID=499177 RepID=E3PU09_ACESD|nr:argininosuccinate lyase [Acetoanaerobium sticklandii]CBH20270.1 argininosuccinate lyase [Acetoanaerobium sticklandii]
MKLWGGRFKTEEDSFMDKFNSSFNIDQRLWEQDIKGSIAHVSMLSKCHILSSDEAEKIIKALEQIHAEILDGSLFLEGEFEDIHSFLEYQVTQKAGAVGKKMHTARSRNDQVALDMKLYVKLSGQEVIKSLEKLISAIEQKSNESSFPMPGYTHLQRAQIVTFKYHLMAYYEMLSRDMKRIENALSIMDTCPLGSCALAGTTYPIDREFTAAMLEFEAVQKNTMDSVSDRDYIIEMISAFSIIMMHLSRLSEEFIIFSTKEFDFIALSDAYSTGSSIMPQKKNPDSLELVRGKTGRLYGNLMGILTTMKALPLTYNKDMQEDKQYYFESLDTVIDCITIIEGVVSTLTVKSENMEKATKGGFLNATELADYLVKQGIAFRDAHSIVGQVVKHCEAKAMEIDQLSLEELKAFSPHIKEDVYSYIEPSSILKQGTKPDML